MTDHNKSHASLGMRLITYGKPFNIVFKKIEWRPYGKREGAFYPTKAYSLAKRDNAWRSD